MNVLTLNKLDITAQHPNIAKLPLQGKLVNCDNYVYLKITDEFIYSCYSLLNRPDVNIPDYFNDPELGAHISVIYPEEGIIVDDSELTASYTFQVKELYSTVLNKKEYFIATVEAPSLVSLRKRYGLSEKLNFRGYSVVLHFTFGVRNLL